MPITKESSCASTRRDAPNNMCTKLDSALLMVVARGERLMVAPRELKDPLAVAVLLVVARVQG